MAEFKFDVTLANNEANRILREVLRRKVEDIKGQLIQDFCNKLSVELTEIAAQAAIELDVAFDVNTQAQCVRVQLVTVNKEV